MSLKKAIALAYLPDKQMAPILLAKGEGEFANRIIRRAKEAGVLVWEDSSLADFLVRIPLDQEIPREVYSAVAIVFKALARLKKEKNI